MNDIKTIYEAILRRRGGNSTNVTTIVSGAPFLIPYEDFTDGHKGDWINNPEQIESYKTSVSNISGDSSFALVYNSQEDANNGFALEYVDYQLSGICVPEEIEQKGNYYVVYPVVK